MIRGTKKPDAIITADWHITEKQPICRTDDFWEAQWRSIEYIRALGIKYNCPVLSSGDTFDHWKASPYLINMCLEKFPLDLKTIAGNHDQPQHNMKLLKKSALYTLALSKSLQLLDQGHFGRDLEEIPYWDFKGRKIIVLHKLVWAGEIPWPGCTDTPAGDLFKTFPEADLIITGDNHKTFKLKEGKRLLVNPGSLMAFTANQIDHRPSVFFWYAKSNTLKQHYLEDSSLNIDRSYIEEKQLQNDKIDEFIEQLKEGWKLTLNFQRNLDMTIKKNKVNSKIKTIILGWMGK